MVTLLPQAQAKKPSFSQRLSAGVGRGLEMGQQLMQEREQEQMRGQQQQSISKLLGPEAANLPPEMQKVFLSEMMKQQGKQSLLGQKQKMFGELFGQKPKEESSFSNQMTGHKNDQTQFDPSMIPDEAILQLSTIDPQMASTARQLKDTALREKREEKRLELAQKKISPEYQRQQHIESSQAQTDVKYNQSLQESQKLNELKEKTLDRLEKLNKKGVTGKPYEKLLEKMGLINITSEGRREFAADVKNLITDIRSILGAQFTGFEFQTILNAYPSADFSKEANESIIKNLKEFQDIKKKEFEIANQIKKENKGKIPQDFQSLVNEKVHEYATSRTPEIKKNTQKIMAEEFGITPGNVLMLDPEGQPLDVSPDEVEKYELLGASLP